MRMCVIIVGVVVVCVCGVVVVVVVVVGHSIHLATGQHSCGVVMAD